MIGRVALSRTGVAKVNGQFFRVADWRVVCISRVFLNLEISQGLPIMRSEVPMGCVRINSIQKCIGNICDPCLS